MSKVNKVADAIGTPGSSATPSHRSKREAARALHSFASKNISGWSSSDSDFERAYNETEWWNMPSAYYLPLLEGFAPNETMWAEAMLTRNTGQGGIIMPPKKIEKPRVLVIGSGPAGLALVRALSQLDPRDDGERRVDLTCYDRYACLALAA